MKKTILHPLLALAGCFATFNGTSTLQAQTTNIWNFNFSGSIVQWTVPSTGIYQISAYGAQGGILSGFYSGGKGAHISGSFTLTGGEVLSILVGGLGQSGGSQNMGGGGGSFVVNSSTNPLVVAGGGAGYGASTGVPSTINASTNTWGNDAAYDGPNLQGSGGTNGNGGTIGSNSEESGGGGGGGFYTDGGTHLVNKGPGHLYDVTNVVGGSSYINGGAGGSGGKGDGIPAGSTSATDGGFGGGGQAGAGGGGGGGYSGGGGGWAVNGVMGGPGGGGGSFLAASASNAVMTIGRTGNGFVSISAAAVSLLVDESITISSGTNDYYNIVLGGNVGDANNSVSVMNAGTVVNAANNILVGQNGSDNTMSVSNGASVVNLGSSVIGLNATASDNSLLVTGTGSTWSSGTALLIGSSGSGNSMSVEAGADVVSEGSGVALGYNVGSSDNSLLIDGVGSTLADSADFVVGFSGSSNAVVISNGGNLTNGQHIYGGVIGLNSGAINNSVLVTGNGSAWNNGGDLLVGWGDSGNTLTISNGGAVTSGQVNYGGAIGFEAGSTGNNIVVTGSGSSWTNGGDLLVGVSGSGNNMTISAGGNVSSGQVDYGGVIGFNAASSNNNIVVTGTGSSWSNSGDLLVGVSGSGNNMTISAGGNVSSGQVNYGGVIGFDASSLNNSVLVTGTGSTWSNSSSLTIGDAGGGTLTIANGGSVSAGSITIASQVGSTGTLNFGSLGGSDTAGGLIGPGISFGSGSGTINFNQVDSLIGSGFSGNGSLNQLGSGTTILTGTNTYTGTTTVNSGTLVVQGQSSLGTSSVTVNGGTLVASGVFTEFPLALNAGNMTLTGAGSSWNTGTNTLSVGNSSQGGSVVVEGGASVVSEGLLALGNNAGASNNSVLVTGSGSRWSTALGNNSYWNVAVGYNGSSNSLVVSNGGQVSATYFDIGRNAVSSNNSVLVTGSGSRLSMTENILIGEFGSGNSLVISDGGSVSSFSAYIGAYAGSSNNSVLVTGSGSILSNNSYYGTIIGYAGEGTLTVANGGVAASTEPQGITVASQSGSIGTLNIGAFGANDTAGTINAPAITFGAGTGVINFNQSDATTISAVISGNGTVNQLGSGTTTLTGNSTYAGATTVAAGDLVVNGSIANSTVTVNNGGTLSGSGSVGGIVINTGGTINPGNSPGTHSVAGNVVWNAGANYNWQIYDTALGAGSGWDLVNATGTLDLSALTVGSEFNINLWSLSAITPDTNGNALNFDPNQNYTWTILTAAGGITGFTGSSQFDINIGAFNGTGGFANALNGGAFSLAQSGNDLNLVFTAAGGPGGPSPVPEPGTWAAAALLAGGAAFMRWRKRNKAS